MGGNIIIDCYKVDIIEYNAPVYSYRGGLLHSITSCLQVNLYSKEGRIIIGLNNVSRVFEICKNTYIAQTPDNDIGFRIIDNVDIKC